MRILHVSDLHASVDARERQRVVTRALLRDVVEQHEQRPIDLVVMSGDLANGGQASEFLLADELLLTPLKVALGMTAERFVLVPGNHDADRARISNFLEVGLKEQLRSQDQIRSLFRSAHDSSEALRRLDAYREFHASFFGKDEPDKVGSLTRIRKMTSKRRSVGIAALDSAWRSFGGSEDFQRLLVGEDELVTALDAIDGCDFKIAVVHHPLSWLDTFDRDAVRREFETRGLLVLCGHEHSPAPTSLFSARGGAVYSHAGCLYESRDYFNGYTIIDLDNDDEVTFTLRTWWPRRTAFGAAEDIAERGILRLPWQRNTKALKKTGYTTVLQAMANVVQSSSLVSDQLQLFTDATVDRLLVNPRFLPLPYSELVAANTTLETAFLVGEPQKDRFTREDPLESLAADEVVLVTGDRESGVTSALIWLASQHFMSEGSHLPVYMRCPDRINERLFGQALRTAATLSGSDFDVTQGTPPLIAAVDDVPGNKEKTLARLIEAIGRYPSCKWILGCHETDHQTVARALAARGIRHRRVFLGPFGRRELRDLLIRLGADTPDLHETVIEMISTHGLPRSPFIMTALVAVLQKEASLRTVNESAVLSAYVRLLLGSEEIVDFEGHEFDYRLREDLLASFAHHLTVRRLRRIPRLDAEKLLATYFGDKGWKQLSPGHVLDNLVARRVLVADASGIGFRHETFQHLFAATWMLENTLFESELLKDPLRNAAILRHAAGMSRKKKTLLLRVSSVLAEAVRDVELQTSIDAFDRFEHPELAPPDEDDLAMLGDGDRAEPDEQRDERLDALDESIESWRLELDDEARDEAREDPFVRLNESAWLLSDLLRSSELVEDVALKQRLVKEIIHAVSVMSVHVNKMADSDTGEESDRLREELSRLGFRFSPEEFTYVFRAVMTMASGIMAQEGLATIHLSGVVEDVAADELFCSQTLHALYIAFLCEALRLKGWVSQFEALHLSHPRDVLLADIIRNWILWSYREDPGSSELRPAEDVLVNIYSDGYPRDTPAEKQAYSRVRDSVRRQLRIGRAKVLGQADDRDLRRLEDVIEGTELPDGARASDEVVAT